jgi:hypothetical protein
MELARPQELLVLGSMRLVAGHAVGGRRDLAVMRQIQVLLVMAGAAQFGCGGDQKGRMDAGVRLVTSETGIDDRVR